MSLCQTRQTRFSSLTRTLPLEHFFLALPPHLFTRSLSFLANFQASFFSLSSLGARVKLGEQRPPLWPRKDVGQKKKWRSSSSSLVDIIRGHLLSGRVDMMGLHSLDKYSLSPFCVAGIVLGWRL